MLNRSDVRIGISWIVAITALQLFGYFRGTGTLGLTPPSGVDTPGGAIIYFLTYWAINYCVAIALFIRAWRKTKKTMKGDTMKTLLIAVLILALSGSALAIEIPVYRPDSRDYEQRRELERIRAEQEEQRRQLERVRAEQERLRELERQRQYQGLGTVGRGPYR
jgi:hypothetical protein